jgi:hypothetical protein
MLSSQLPFGQIVMSPSERAGAGTIGARRAGSHSRDHPVAVATEPT